MLKSFFS